MNWEVDGDRIQHFVGEMHRSRDLNHRARLKVEAMAEGLSIGYYDEDTPAFQAAYRDAVAQVAEVSAMPMRYMPTNRNVMWVEPDEDDEVQVFRGFEPRPSTKPMCSSSRCHCGNGKSSTQCEWWKARNTHELATTTDPAVIAQQLWQESRELLAEVGVELPASPPAPAQPRRWYQWPIVDRLRWGFLVGGPFAGMFWAIGLGWLWPIFVSITLTVAFITYDGVRNIRVPLQGMVARLVAIEMVTVSSMWWPTLG